MLCVDLSYLEKVRAEELDHVRQFLPPAARVLDFGAGPGHQALHLQHSGYAVEAVDLNSSAYVSSKVFPVCAYDGKRLPFPDGHFDVVFSSNVLEHVKDLEATLDEMHRVLRPGGTTVHVLPSATWRLWSWLAEFVSAPRNVIRCLRAERSALKLGHVMPKALAAVVEAGARLVRPFLILPHGEGGTALSELYTFSRHAWARKFRRLGLDVREIQPLGLFYTGEMLLGPKLSSARRRRLAKFLGSSTVLWVTSPSGRTQLSRDSKR